MRQLDARRTQRQEAAKRISHDIMPSEGRSEEEQQKINSALYDAAMSGNVISIQKLLEEGADISARFDNLRHTALHIAAMQDHHNACAVLLAKGADPFAVDDLGGIPLHKALGWKSSPMVVRVLEDGMARALVGKENGKEFVWSFRACISS